MSTRAPTHGLGALLLGLLVVMSLPALSEPEGPSADAVTVEVPAEDADRLELLEQRLQRTEEQLQRLLQSQEGLPAAADGTPQVDLDGRLTSEPLGEATPEAGEERQPVDSAGFGAPVYVAPGSVVSDALAFGAPVTVEGRVNGDAVSFGARVLVTSSGVVEGDAVSLGSYVQVEPGGRVMGDRVSVGGRPPAVGAEDSQEGASAGLLRFLGAERLEGLARRLVLLLCLAGAGVLVLGTFPDRVGSIAAALERHPVRYGVAGALLALGASLVSLIAAMTIIGLPVAALVMLLVGVAWLVGFVALGQYLGGLVPGHRFGPIGAFLIGMLTLTVLGMVPYLGKLVLIISAFPALGAAVATRLGGTR